MSIESGGVPKLSQIAGKTGPFKLADAKEFAALLRLPESWIRAQSRSRVPRERRIPCVRFGRYVRYEIGSPQLEAWLARHRE